MVRRSSGGVEAGMEEFSALLAAVSQTSQAYTQIRGGISEWLPALWSTAVAEK